MRRRLSSGLLIFVGIASLCGLASYFFLHRGDPPGSWRDPPLYPGAQQVAVQDFGEWGKYEQDIDGRIVKVITFTTADIAQQVKQFYAQSYAGWVPYDDGWGRNAVASDRLNYSSIPRFIRSPPVYSVHILLNGDSTGQIQVTVGVTYIPGY